ncbi:DUF1622 domain-containing protein [Enterococcus alishanensis]
MADLHQQLDAFIFPIFELISSLLNIVSILILIIGAVVASKDFFTHLLTQKFDRLDVIQQNRLIKAFLGSYVLLSLELLIVADIIDSIINPTFQDIFRLGLIVIIRTVISYFLSREIQEGQTDLKK